MSLREFIVVGDGTSHGTEVFDEDGLPVKGISRIEIDQTPGAPPMIRLEIVGIVKFESKAVPE